MTFEQFQATHRMADVDNGRADGVCMRFDTRALAIDYVLSKGFALCARGRLRGLYVRDGLRADLKVLPGGDGVWCDVWRGIES